MLTCIACSKRLNNRCSPPRDREEDVDVAAFETLRTKHAMKALTAQVCMLCFIHLSIFCWVAVVESRI
jgi:hypothetical protein